MIGRERGKKRGIESKREGKRNESEEKTVNGKDFASHYI